MRRELQKAVFVLRFKISAQGAQAEIEGIWTLMSSDETRKRVAGFLGG
jgi:hypothetical protein